MSRYHTRTNLCVHSDHPLQHVRLLLMGGTCTGKVAKGGHCLFRWILPGWRTRLLGKLTELSTGEGKALDLGWNRLTQHRLGGDLVNNRVFILSSLLCSSTQHLLFLCWVLFLSPLELVMSCSPACSPSTTTHWQNTGAIYSPGASGAHPVLDHGQPREHQGGGDTMSSGNHTAEINLPTFDFSHFTNLKWSFFWSLSEVSLKLSRYILPLQKVSQPRKLTYSGIIFEVML